MKIFKNIMLIFTIFIGASSINLLSLGQRLERLAEETEEAATKYAEETATRTSSKIAAFISEFVDKILAIFRDLSGKSGVELAQLEEEALPVIKTLAEEIVDTEISKIGKLPTAKPTIETTERREIVFIKLEDVFDIYGVNPTLPANRKIVEERTEKAVEELITKIDDLEGTATTTFYF